MKRTLALALAVSALAAPAAMAQGNSHGSKHGVVEYQFKGVVNADASATSVDLVRVVGTSKSARRSLNGATTLTVKLSGATRIRGVHGKRLGFAALVAGDRVTVVIRAKRGTSAADLPAARLVVDRGPSGLASVPPPVVEPPVVEPPVVPPPVVTPPILIPPVLPGEGELPPDQLPQIPGL